MTAKSAEKESALELEKLQALMYWDDLRGSFINKVNRSSNSLAGEPSGSLRKDGYRAVVIGRYVYLEHRLVWFYFHGVWPEFELDHKDFNKSNNRLNNLRPATRAQQLQHTHGRGGTSKYAGVGRHKASGKWYATININKKRAHLGLFCSEQDAIIARRNAESEHYPFRLQELVV